MTSMAKISFLLERKTAHRFDAYCREKGFKKSSLIARPVREYLEKDERGQTASLFEDLSQEEGGERG